MKLRPLKQRYARYRAFRRIQPGPIRTLYPISAADARRLVARRRSTYQVDIDDVTRQVEPSVSGGGFGSAEENRKVETAAISHVRDYFQRTASPCATSAGGEKWL